MDQEDLRETEVKWECLVSLESMEYLDCLDLLDLEEFLDWTVAMELRGAPVDQACQDRRGHLADQDLTDLRARKESLEEGELGSKDKREKLEGMDNLVSLDHLAEMDLLV